MLSKQIVKSSSHRWILKTTLIAFLISLVFTLFSEIAIPQVNIFVGIFFVMIFILLGIIFDILGIAVATANIKSFHSMNSKKIKGASIAVQLKKNAALVATYSNDVIGDVCGIVSGSTSIIISIIIASKFNINPLLIGILFTSIVAALTIGGKALGKSFAIKNSDYILYKVAKFLANFYKNKK